MSTEPTLTSIAEQTRDDLVRLWQEARARLRQKVRDGLARLRQRTREDLAALVAGRRRELAAGHDVGELAQLTATLTALREELALFRNENHEEHLQLYLAAFGLVDEEVRLETEEGAPDPWSPN